jgi:hypothetical protein
MNEVGLKELGIFLRGSSVRGNWRGGSFGWDPKDMLSKVLEMGVCFRRGPAFGEYGWTLLSYGL